jgi:hypothetical protein
MSENMSKMKLQKTHHMLENICQKYSTKKYNMSEIKEQKTYHMSKISEH